MFNFSGTQKKLMALGFLVAGGIAVAGVAWVFPTASNQGYAPEQPIPFSHKIMAGDFKIPCLYCHTGADKSKHALVPSMNVCMNCHSAVKPDSPYIQKLKQVYAEGKTFEWVRVHELPDFVFFSHERHVSKGVQCESCHGDVKKMERIVQVQPLTMGWCLDCHKGVTTPPEVLARVYPGQKNPRGPVAPIQCNTCHQ